MLFAGLGDGLVFDCAEGGFAVGVDVVGHAADPGADGVINVDKGAAELRSEGLADGGLAGAGHTDEDDVLVVFAHAGEDRRDLCGRIFEPDEAAGGVDSLCDEHRQPVADGHTAALSIKEKLAAAGVVDDIEAGFELCEACEIDESCTVVGIHADRRRVHDDLGIMVQGDICVRNGVVPAEDDDLPCAFISEDGADSLGGGTVAEHEAFLVGDLDAGAVEGVGEAVVVGIGAEKAAVRTTQEGVDAADALRLFIDLITVRHDRFFVRNGHIDAAPAAVVKEGRDVRRFDLKELIAVIADLCVDLWGKTVAQGAAEESETHKPISTFL